tara:strand:- start:128 stop:610 length:483 start_codon:yes stop_codon:yes gene_type:complete
MINFKNEIYLIFLFILSLFVLAIAYFIQYIFGYQPCNLCIIERVPYALAIIILILNHFFKKNRIFYTVLLLLVFAFSFLISVYHLGIEQGFIEESTVCASTNVGLIEKEDILDSLTEIRISCKDVAFRILNLSLTTYNVFISLLMFFISAKIYQNNNGNK